MMCRVIPASLDRAITEKLDEAFLECPGAEKDREVLHAQLIDFFDEHGHLPDFTLSKRARPTLGPYLTTAAAYHRRVARRLTGQKPVTRQIAAWHLAMADWIEGTGACPEPLH